jgi:hypothetical protein
MQQSLLRGTAIALALALMSPVALLAQGAPPSPPGQTDQAAPRYDDAQLDQLLAPIALYPDQLLGQVLMASTYPLEVVEAARWLQDPGNAALRGDELAAALEQQDWDPSVKSLVPFPTVIQMMNDRLEWMQKLGDAFLAQQAEVMDSAQRLRREAADAGKLQSTPQQVVTTQGSDIAIQPADPNVVYVPVYDPGVVYGGWPYPDYPPYFFPPPPGYPYGPALAAGIGFGIGFGVVGSFWGWDDFDWDRHRVHIDRDRFDDMDRHHRERFHREAVTGDTWQHDPDHRKGVAYHDPISQQKFARPTVGTPFPAVQGGGSNPPPTDRRLTTIPPGQGVPQQGNTQMPTVLRGGSGTHTPPPGNQGLPQGVPKGNVQSIPNQGGHVIAAPQGQQNSNSPPPNLNRGVQERRVQGGDNRNLNQNQQGER